MSKQDGTQKVNASATVVDAVNGIVRYDWVTGNLDEAARFLGEFEITFGDGTKLTVPNGSYLQINILNDLG